MRVSRLVLVLAGASVAWLLAGWGEKAHALCVADPMNGTWVNVDDQTRNIARVEYRQVCHDVIRCPDGRCEPVPAHVAVVRVFGRCHPRDCDWGPAKVYRHARGAWKYALYELAGTKRTVWLRLEPDGRLTVVDKVSYRGDRPDREIWNTLRKASRPGRATESYRAVAGPTSRSSTASPGPSRAALAWAWPSCLDRGRPRRHRVRHQHGRDGTAFRFELPWP